MSYGIDMFFLVAFEWVQVSGARAVRLVFIESNTARDVLPRSRVGNRKGTDTLLAAAFAGLVNAQCFTCLRVGTELY